MHRLSALTALVALGLLSLAGALCAEDLAKPVSARPRVEVVFCLDTTGSMGGLLAGAQAKIWSIVNGIVSGKPVPSIKVGLVAYRDRNDAYITQVTDLTANLDAVHQTLFGLQAAGGGDGPESVNQALADAVNKISWSPKGEKVYRVIFLVGDAPPHMNYANDVKYPETCQAAVLKDLVVNTVRCGGDAQTETAWQEIARKSEGQYTSIDQGGGVQVVSTPYDAKLAELSGKLVGTAVYGGRKESQEMARRAQLLVIAEAEKAKESKDAPALAMAADKSEFRGKSAAAAPSAAPAEAGAIGGMGMGEAAGRADLTNAFARDGEKALSALKKDELPEEMQKMSAGEQKEFLEKKTAERGEIQKKIDELSKQRVQFLQAELKKRGSGDKGFDGVVIKMLKEQGAKKGIEYGGAE